MSIVCQVFGVSPEVAMAMDPRYLFPIMEYRVAEDTKQKVNAKQSAEITEPAARLMDEMVKAMATE